MPCVRLQADLSETAKDAKIAKIAKK